MPLKLVRRPKSPYWIIRGTLRGIRIEESTGVSEKRAAEEIRAKREAEILAESVYGRCATVTFASAAVSYLEHGGSKRFLEPIIEYFGTMPLAKIDQDPSTAVRLSFIPTHPTRPAIGNSTRRRWRSSHMLLGASGANASSYSGLAVHKNGRDG